jgi:probable rRNA maturation factor
MVVRIEAPGRKAPEVRRLRRALKRMARRMSVGPGAEVSIALVSDREIESLNERYLHRSGPTDVISFPLVSRDEAGAAGAGGRRRPEPLGDIVISVDTAAVQARENGHPLATEMELLAAHGLLHLLGFDHDSREGTREMAEAERVLTGRSIIMGVTGDS